MKATIYMLESMRGTRPWIVFLAILGFINCFLTIVAGVFGAIGATAQASEGSEAIGLVVLPLILVINGIVLLYPLTRLWAFSNALGQFNEVGALGALEAGLAQHRKFWQAWGIITLATLALNGLSVTLLILLGLLAGTAA